MLGGVDEDLTAVGGTMSLGRASLPQEMTAGPGSVEPDGVPPDVAARIVRALDRSPSCVVTLVNPDLTIRWLSQSARWVTGSDPSTRKGDSSLERIHPDDVERLLYGLEVLRAARPTDAPTVPVVGPVRYRFQRFDDDRWVVMEAVIHNLLDDPLVEGLLVESRPVEGGLDAVGHVVDLLVANAPLQEVLAACARLVPAYVGSTAVVAFLDSRRVIGAPADSPAQTLSTDDRWWRPAVTQRRTQAPVNFAGFPGELAARARAQGFRTAWVFPLRDESSADVMGCVVIWVQIDVQLNIGIDDALRQTQRLASLVIGEERRHLALRQQAVTDPLTGVSNRSALRRRLDTAPGPVTLAIVDLDDFKPINDTHGHDTGDAVLQVVADRLRGAVRADDLVVRYGGDEFAVVFANQTPTDGAAQLVQRIIAAIEAPIALHGKLPITIGASIGLATANAAAVVHQADASLYHAKAAKRHTPSPDHPPNSPAEPSASVAPRSEPPWV
ncbi:MAG TPA: GGDEF domain-containing protein [Jiangellaceae bacterium]|nr:GGDEF domain-containing protein [Jiangellaceae bacterium]